MGYDMSWASFNVVEVMSSARFHLKSVGYLAAIQSFNQDTDVLMLTTNLLKKVNYERICSMILSLTSIHPGFELYSCRYSCHLEWNLTYRHTRLGPRLKSRTRCNAQSFSSTYSQASNPCPVQSYHKIPRCFL